MTELQEFASRHKPIFWDVSSTTLEKMSDVGIVERFLAYGTWEDYKHIEQIIGRERAKSIFKERAYMPRTNLREETINLFTYYFQLDASSERPLSRAI